MTDETPVGTAQTGPEPAEADAPGMTPNPVQTAQVQYLLGVVEELVQKLAGEKMANGSFKLGDVNNFVQGTLGGMQQRLNAIAEQGAGQP